MTAYVSNNSGNWGTTTIWTPNGTPGIGDKITINYSHTVTIDGSRTIGTVGGNSISLTGGILNWSTNPSGNWTLTVQGDIQISNGGQFNIGQAGFPIPANRTATVVFTYNHAVVSVLASGGAFRAYGSPNYGMANQTAQRTQLVGAVLAGAGVAFQTTEPVDWQNGSEVWVGIGGDKTVAPTTIEQITITGKVDASNYTATFLYNHAKDCFLVNGIRNILIRGNSTTEEFWISNATTPLAVYFNFDWVHFKWVSRGANFLTYNFTLSGVANLPAGRLQITNCLFNASFATHGGIYLVTNAACMDSDTCYDYNHFYGPFTFAHQFSSGVDGHWKLNHYTLMGIRAFVSEITSTINRHYVSSDGIWYCSNNTGISNIIFQNTKIKTISNFKFTSFYQMHLFTSTLSAIVIPNSLQTTFENGIIYHGGAPVLTYAFQWNSTDAQHQLLMKNVDWYDVPYCGIYLQKFHGDVYFDNCTFNSCGTSSLTNLAPKAPICITQATSLGRVRFYNCKFGTIAQNKYFNVAFETSLYAQDWAIQSGSRIIFEKCQVKIPASFAWAGAASSSWTNTLGWFLKDGGTAGGLLNNWVYRSAWSSNQTLEIINSEALDAAVVDQWPISYPDVDRLGVVTGGAEIRKETITVIDNTFALKILPFSCVDRAWVTRKVPIKIPVSAGQTVTVKLSLRKNQSQATGRRPMIHLYGLGIDTYSEMSDVISSWEELTVSGTASIDGIVEFYVSAMNEYNGTIAYNPDNFYSPQPLEWLVIYADGLLVTVV